MSDLQADPKALHGAAEQVNTHAEELQSKHAAADATIAAAQAGFVGQSADALGPLMDQWSGKTRELHSALTHHAKGIHSAAQNFSTTEESNSESFESGPS